MRKTTSVRELHIRTSDLVREAAEGAVIIIEKRGQPVAELRPLSPRKELVPLPDMESVWKSMPALDADSGRFLEEDR